jgi:hypothetical protein
MVPEPITALIQDVSDLLAISDGQRELIDGILRSVTSAIQRVGPEHREELQKLVAAYVTDPEDRDVEAKLGALLRQAPRPDH